MKKRPPDAAEGAARSDGLKRQWWVRTATPILLVIGTWLLVHPYRGIVHDARLYAVQALHKLNPGIFDRDLFFAFGSQDDFTLFTALFAPLVDAAGTPLASMLAVGFGHALWLSAAAALAMRLAPSKAAAFAGLLLLAGLPSSYGGWQLFSYGEGFATPRLLAEGFGLWALWALTRGNLALATAFAAASGMLHPIMCLTMLLVGFLFLVARDRRWIAAGLVGVLAVVLAAYFDIGPLGRLAQTMDAEWLAVVEARNAYLFPGHWRQGDWGRCVIALALVLATAFLLSGWRRALLLATAAAASAGIAANYLAVDLMHNVLLIQLQLYRVLWLLNVMAYLGAGILLVRLWALREDGHALVALLAFSIFLAFAMLPMVGMAVFAFGLALSLGRLSGRLPPLSRPLQFACLGLAAVLALGLGAYRAVSIWGEVKLAFSVGLAFLGASVSVTVLDVAVVTVILILLVWYRPAALRASLPALAIALFMASLLTWDRSDPWTRMVWTGQAATAPAWSLPPEMEVFWENDAVNAWAILRQPSYVSAAQGAGIGFARDTALTFRRRMDVVQPLMSAAPADLPRAGESRQGDLPDLDRAMLSAACSKDPVLGALVLSRAVAGSYAAHWDTPVPYYGKWLDGAGSAQRPITRFYLYRCDDIRRAAPNLVRVGGGTE